MSSFDDMPLYTMAEWMGQKAEIDRLRAELAHMNDAWSQEILRVERAEARLAAVLALCDVHPTRNYVLAARCDRIRAAAIREAK